MYTQYLATFQIVGGNSLLFCRAGWADLQSLNESMASQFALPVQQMEGLYITKSTQLTSTTDVPGGNSVNSMPCDCPWLRNASLRASLDIFGTGTTCK